VTQSRGGRRRDRPWSAFVVVGAGIALIALGIGGRLTSPGRQGASPSASATAASASTEETGGVRSPGPLPSVAVAGDPVLDVSDPGSAIRGTLSRRLDGVSGPGRYDVAVVCLGPGTLVLARADHSNPPLEVDCDGATAHTDLVTDADENAILVTVDNRAAWRVVAGMVEPAVAAATPTPTPQPTAVTPAAACGPTNGLSEPPAASLVVRAKATPGERGWWAWNGRAADRGRDPVSSVAIGLDQQHAAEIRIAGDVCATSWQITAHGTGADGNAGNAGLETTLARAENPGQFAGSIAQNRFAVDGIGPGEWIVRAALTFPQGSEVLSWRVKTDAFLFGRGVLTVGSQRVAGELLGCPGWFVGDAGGQDDCGPLPWFVAGAPTLRLARPASARFELPGWAIDDGTVTVVRTADAKRTSTPSPISQAIIPEGSAFADVRIPAGDVVVRISVGARRSNAGFDEDYVFHALVGG
jgi:hypothetical protein